MHSIHPTHPIPQFIQVNHFAQFIQFTQFTRFTQFIQFRFWVVLEDLKVPVGCEEINWAKNWLAQHIKNTDHQYKTRLEHAEEGANFSGALP